MARFSNAVKKAALEMVKTSGVAAASKKFKVSEAGLRLWMKDEKKTNTAKVITPTLEQTKLAQLAIENSKLKMIVADFVLRQLQ